MWLPSIFRACWDTIYQCLPGKWQLRWADYLRTDLYWTVTQYTQTTWDAQMAGHTHPSPPISYVKQICLFLASNTVFCGCEFPATCPALYENLISVTISIQNHKLIKMSSHCRTFKSEAGAVILRTDSFPGFFDNTLLNEPESELTLFHFCVSLQLEKVVFCTWTFCSCLISAAGLHTGKPEG